MIKAEEILFNLTGTYDAPPKRSYEANVNDRMINRAMRRTNGGKNFTSSALGSLSQEILRPGKAFGRSDIINGWGEKRLHFVFVLSTKMGGAEFLSYLSGYTDGVGVNSPIAAGRIHFAPDMRLYFNSIITLRKTAIIGRHGKNFRYSVLDNAQILSKNESGMIRYGSYDLPEPNSYIRPFDVFCKLSSMAFVGDKTGLVADYRSGMGETVELSNRSSLNMAKYLEKVLKSHKDAVREAHIVGDMEDLHFNASEEVYDGDVSENDLLGQISMRSSYLEDGYITYQEAEQLISGFDEKAALMGVGQLERVSASPSEVTDGYQHWYGDDDITIAATVIKDSITSIMTECFLSRVGFTVHNDTVDGRAVFKPMSRTSYSSMGAGLPLDELCEMFNKRFETLVLDGISRKGMIPYRIAITASLFGETRMNIIMNSQPPVPYVSTTFADGLLSPMITSSNDDVLTLAHSVGDLAVSLNIGDAGF